jgi:large subunit ribosomal protein L17
MVTSLFEHERITTTLPKAKELRPMAEKLITLAKRGTLHARRQAAQVIRGRDALKKLFDTIGPRFSQRPGGYTRIIKLGRRSGDAAPLAFIELIEGSGPEVQEAKSPKAARRAKRGEGSR